MRVLAVGCHPDDLEIHCYGTLIRYIQAGNEVVVASIANGSMGSMTILPEELAKIRTKEAADAAKCIGAEEYICLNVSDLDANSAKDEQLNAAVDLIRYAKPDLIITQPGDDYQRDHNEAHNLIWTAGFMSSIPHYQTKLPFHKGPQPMYFFTGPAPFRPTDYVDISNVIEQKLEALSCHKSQIEWLSDHAGKSVVDSTRTRDAFFGGLCGCDYAEGFTRCDSAQRMTASRLLP